MSCDLHQRVVQVKEKGSGEVTYMHDINSDDFIETHMEPKTHSLLLWCFSSSHTPAHTHIRTYTQALPQPERRLRLEIKTILCV